MYNDRDTAKQTLSQTRCYRGTVQGARSGRLAAWRVHSPSRIWQPSSFCFSLCYIVVLTSVWPVDYTAPHDWP